MKDDAISRQAAIDALNDEITITGKTNAVIVQDYIRRVNNRLHDLPSVQSQRKTDEWCSDCKEYDQEKHCCPRFNQVIRQTLSEQPEIIRCKDCRYQDKGCNESESWNLCGYRPWLHVPTEDEHYCGYAERRTEND